MLMATYGTITTMGMGKRHHMENGVKNVLMFLYPEVVYNHLPIQSQHWEHAPNLHGGDMNDCMMAELSFLYFVGTHNVEYSKC